MTAVSFCNRCQSRLGLYLICGWLLGSLTVWNGGQAWAAPDRSTAAPSLRVFCDTAAWIGDSLALKLQYEGGDPRNVLFPVLDPLSCPGLEFYAATPQYDTLYDKATGRFRLQAIYPFAVYQAGTYTIPPVSIRVLEDGDVLVYDTDTLYLNIYEPDIDLSQAIRDIKDIQHVSAWERFGDFCRRNLWWLISGAVLLAGAGFVWYYLRRKRRNLPVFSAPRPAVPPLDQALADLKQLKEKQLWQQNRLKEYYTELTDILRIFLAGHTHIAAVEMTSDECLEALRQHYPDRQEAVRDLGRVFRTADLVKFAKGEPQASEHQECFRLIWQFIASHKTEMADDRTAVRETVPPAETLQTRADDELA